MTDEQRRVQRAAYMRLWRRKRRGEALRRQEDNRAFWGCLRRIVREEVTAAVAKLLADLERRNRESAE